jgi:hypothetical protein
MRMTIRYFSLLFTVALWWIDGPVLAQESELKPLKFDQLVQLIGNWEGKKPSQNGEESITVRYQMTAKGTAVMETLFPGSPKEMVSVYARDGQEIVMTHYCMLGNQPRMRSVKQDHPNKFTLLFIDGTGMRSHNDMHMHELTITYIDHNSQS